MVGRSAELQRLAALVPTGVDAPPEVAFLGGEAGVGKSRLTRELAATTAARGIVLAGQAAQGTPGRPFATLLEAVEPMVSGWTELPADLRAREEPMRLLLAPVSPGLDAGVDRPYGPEELLRAAVELIRYLVEAGPALIVFEDLHWADPDSVAVFGRLASAPALPAMLLGTYRPEELGRRSAMTELLVDLERRRSVVHVRLQRLDQAAVGEMLNAVYDRPVSYAVTHHLFHRTGGNPFFLEELLLSAGDVEPERLIDLPLPWSLSELVLRHLEGLTPEGRRVVDAAAVLGQRISFDLLAAVAGTGEDELIDVLRQVVAAGLLVEMETDVFAFRHALTREAVIGQLLGRERRRLHEKALVTLQELGSNDYAALAHHAEGAGRYDELVDAARSGAQHYIRLGSTWQALQLAEVGLAEAEDDIELLRTASEAAWLVGMLDSAIERAVRWRSVADATANVTEEGAALRHLARVHWEMGRPDLQLSMAESALALAEPGGPSSDLAAAHALVSEAHMLAGRADEAIVHADRALELCDEVGCHDIRPRALVNKATALTHLPSRRDEGGELLLQARAEAQAMGDSFSHQRALNNLVGHVMNTWPPDKVRELLDEQLQVSERYGRLGSAMSMWATLGAELAEVEGDMAAAIDYLDQGRRRDPNAMLGVERIWYRVLDVLYALEVDDLERAGALLADFDTDPDLPYKEIGWPVALGVAIAARAGRLDEVASGLAQLVRWPDKPWSHDAREPMRWALPVALRAGFPVSDATEYLEALRQPTDFDWHPSWQLHVDGAAAEAASELEAAVDLYRAANADLDYRRSAYLMGDSDLGAARCLLSLGRRAEAADAAESAARRLERWPGWRQKEAHALLRRLGREKDPAGQPSAVGLTPREQEVAQLVGEGLTNGEIARRLYISTKTASVHVSNILAKLGMSSRTEVAAWVVRQ
jgi:DNA-binding NarL/FixJ family response regulator/tetratricopeptide (TPR) repeat protein